MSIGDQQLTMTGQKRERFRSLDSIGAMMNSEEDDSFQIIKPNTVYA